MTERPQPLQRRRAGVLLHPTSLPGAGEHGDLGPEAWRFVDFLADAGFSVWQTLPLGPTHEDRSPYQCLSAHAGNPALIAAEPLVEAGWLDGSRIAGASRRDWLAAAHRGFDERADAKARAAYASFCDKHAHWLQDFTLFMVLRGHHRDAPWWEWPEALRDRDAQALSRARRGLAGELEQRRFEQFLFFSQWARLKDHAERNGVVLFGDLPIFVAYDSAEVWAQREYFAVDAHGRAEVVAGVPPDYFSETGQRWGNPHYRWSRMAEDDYRWWVERMHTQLELFDWVRIDHFRGFAAFWAIPAEAETAIEGHWVEGPGDALFDALRRRIGALPLVAEDLGFITEDVRALRRRLGLPGMKVLQFAFDGADNPYLPHNHAPDYVVYTGTHDNDTTLGWFEHLDATQQARVHEYLGRPEEAMPWPLIRTALASVAMVAVVPMQDLLALGAEHRMNRPGRPEGNWQWRFEWPWLPEGLAERLRSMVAMYGRSVSVDSDQ